MGTTTAVRGAHLVGSINLQDAETAMRAAAGVLGARLKRLPDGEPGDRSHWVAFLPQSAAARARLENPGYADAAIASYATFVALRDEGVIAPGIRFQVSLPSPITVIGSSVAADDRAAAEPEFAAKLFAELDAILTAIPHGDLAIQWDLALEFALIENAGSRVPMAAWWVDGWWNDAWSGVIERTIDLLARVPADVESGLHLCYGDAAETHYVEPEDAEHLVRVVNAVAAVAPRVIEWIHLPVPIDRDDATFFAPLADLAAAEGTELYLGVVHREDGIEGARRRIEAAARYAPEFGIATECGMGRAPRDTALDLLELHRDLAGTW